MFSIFYTIKDFLNAHLFGNTGVWGVDASLTWHHQMFADKDTAYKCWSKVEFRMNKKKRCAFRSWGIHLHEGSRRDYYMQGNLSWRSKSREELEVLHSRWTALLEQLSEEEKWGLSHHWRVFKQTLI